MRLEELLQDAMAGDPRLAALLDLPCAASAPALQALYVTRSEAAAICRAAAGTPLQERLWPEHPLVGAAVAVLQGGRRSAARVVGAAAAVDELPAPDAEPGTLILTDMGSVALSDLEDGAGPLTDIAWQAAWREAAARAAGSGGGGGGGSGGGCGGPADEHSAVLGSLRAVSERCGMHMCVGGGKGHGGGGKRGKLRQHFIHLSVLPT